MIFAEAAADDRPDRGRHATAASARSSSPACSPVPSNADGARALIDFMLSERFQAAVPESMFVLPVRDGTPLPAAFRRYAVSPAAPLELRAAEIGRNRDRWIDEWTQTVLR